MRNLLKSLGTDGSCTHLKERLSTLIEPLSNPRLVPSWEKRDAAECGSQVDLLEARLGRSAVKRRIISVANDGAF